MDIPRQLRFPNCVDITSELIRVFTWSKKLDSGSNQVPLRRTHWDPGD